MLHYNKNALQYLQEELYHIYQNLISLYHQQLLYYNSSSYGIKITGSSNRIYGCYLGPHPSGEAAAGNGYGIMITGGQNNIIGSC